MSTGATVQETDKAPAQVHRTLHFYIKAELISGQKRRKTGGLAGRDCNAGESGLPEEIPYEDREWWAVQRRGAGFFEQLLYSTPHVTLTGRRVELFCGKECHIPTAE